MKNRTLAIFGIAAYILSIFAYAEDLEGNYVAPVLLIIVSTIATIAFTILATIRVWRTRKITAILFLVSSAITLVYTIPIVRGINTLLFIWIVIVLWSMAKREGLIKNFQKKSGYSDEELSLVQGDLEKGDKEEALQKITSIQEQHKKEFKEVTGIDARDIIPEIGKEISWADIVNHVFRIYEFDRNGTTINENNQIVAKSRFQPYGYLLAESPILNNRVKLPIIHRDDYFLATTVFDEPKLINLVESDEFIVTYSPKILGPKGLSGSPHHVLHYAIVPKGTLDYYYSVDNDAHMAKPEPNKLVGSFVYDGEIRVQINSEPNI